MKKLIVLAAVVLPLLAAAQTSTSMGASKGVKVLPNFYGEILLTQQQNRDIVRIVFDQTSSRMVTDKQVRNDMEEMRKRSFGSLLEAMNVVSAMGWTIGESYETERRDDEEIHVIISKPTLLTLREQDARAIDGKKGTNSTGKGNGGVGIKPKK